MGDTYDQATEVEAAQIKKTTPTLQQQVEALSDKIAAINKAMQELDTKTHIALMELFGIDRDGDANVDIDDLIDNAAQVIEFLKDHIRDSETEAQRFF